MCIKNPFFFVGIPIYRFEIKFNRFEKRLDYYGWGLPKVQTEFRIVAMAHNLLKTAGIHQLFSGKNEKNVKTGGERQYVFLHLFYFLELIRQPRYFLLYTIFTNLHQTIFIKDKLNYLLQLDISLLFKPTFFLRLRNCLYSIFHFKLV